MAMAMIERRSGVEYFAGTFVRPEAVRDWYDGMPQFWGAARRLESTMRMFGVTAAQVRYALEARE